MTITRTRVATYAVVTDTVLSDGSYRSDDMMRMDGRALVSHERSGHIRTGGPMRIELGPISYAAVSALAIGESFITHQARAARQ